MIQGSNSGRGERSFQTALGPTVFSLRARLFSCWGDSKERWGWVLNSIYIITETKNQWRCLSTLPIHLQLLVKIKTGLSRAKQERQGRGIALHLLNTSARRGLVLSFKSGLLYPQKKPLPNLQVAGFASARAWMGSKNLAPIVSIFETSSPCCVTIPTELRRPALKYRTHYN
jgi:hypothetical protein